jgi:hypothetical protein
MALIDDIIKWFKKPKTWQGIAGIIVIVIVLALDFAYWAGAIKVEEFPTESGGGEAIVEIEIPDDYNVTITDTLERGSNAFPFIPDPRGEEEGVTYNLYPVPIEHNITEISIESTGDPGSPPRGDGGDRNDIDLYFYEPGKDAGGNQADTSPDYSAATPYINEVMNIPRRSQEVGNWTLRVDCFTGSNVQYTITIEVSYFEDLEE